MSLHYLVKYLCSKNRRAQQVDEANCHVRLGRSKTFSKYLSNKILRYYSFIQYGIDVCPMNSAVRRSLQFVINKIMYKIFGAISKDLYIEISPHFGIEYVENLVANRRNRFINRYGETDIYDKCCAD